MVQITYTLRLDMRDTGIVNTSLRLKQGDSGMKIAVNVFNGGVSAFDSSTTPKIVFRRPDGASVMADMTVESSLYSYTLVGNELQVPGKELIDIKFPIGAEGRESTMSCSIEVVPDTITPNTHGSGIYDNDLAELVEEATEAAETVQEVVGDSEAWANGERNGVPVGPEDPAYHNNSKYWSEQANPTALANLTDVDVDGVVNGDLLQYNSTTHKWETSNTVIEQVEDNAEGIEELNDAWKKNGAYNLCPNEATTQVNNGVTYTVSADGTITTSGATTTNTSQLTISNVSLKKGTYKAVGCPTGGSSNPWTYYVIYKKDNASGETLGYDEGNGCTLTLATDMVVNVRIIVNTTIDMSGKTFKPMITTDLNATYDDYQPHAMTNRELTQALGNVKEIRTGKFNFTNGASISGSVTYNTPFTSTGSKLVLITPESGSTTQIHAFCVNGQSNTGFNYIAKNITGDTSSANRVAQYIAMSY